MYKALYRKYRPIRFEDVVGQGHITKVLQNQLKTNTISHAYLFSGTRGTGKTSCAKIFARAVNCESDDVKPCNVCSSCIESLEDSAIDIIEIDGASNSGVDNIRDLKDRAFYQPTSLKYKVYIIDEVHMLTRPAFNALLKILEEPPSHLIFILATTEPERIPLTILSRCQKFQFRRISPKEVKASLKRIAEIEGISIDDKTYSMIINNSDGSMRDAQSIMEQLVSTGKKDISYDYAADVLGIVSTDILFDLVDSVIEGDAGRLLKLLDETISAGKEIEQLGKDILNHFRNLMIGKVSAESLNRLVHSNEEGYLNQSNKLTLEQILCSMERIINQLNEIKYTQQKRTLLEIVMLEILNIDFNMFLEEKDIDNSSKKISDRYLKKDNKEIENVMGIKASKDNDLVVESQEDSTSSIHAENVIESNSDNKSIELTIAQIRNDWNEILAEVRNSSRKLLHAYIIEASLVDYKNNTIILGFDKTYEFHRNNLMKLDNREFLEKVISMFYNIDIKIDSVFLQNNDKNSIEKDIESLTKLVGADNIKIL